MTVLSNDRQKVETKLERLSKRAGLHKETVFNNLGHLIDKTLLRELYQRTDGTKALGIDGMSKDKYGINLDRQIENLIERMRKGNYKPKPSRMIEIPKEDGSKRPLAIACFEDKLVQSAVSLILTQIYEPLFQASSFGFRPGQNCHDALRALMKHTYRCWNGAVVEIDICKYFNSVPHKELRKILEKKISDERFLRLIDKLVMAPTIKEGVETANTIGCPQGSILSPILANIYLHEVIDTWFSEIKIEHFEGIAEEVRYVDDMVFIFQHYTEAKRFFEVLPKRLEKYGLKMQLEKSHLIRSGQNIANTENRKGKKLPTYNFLGFTIYWGKARNGKWWRPKMISRRDRFTAKLNGLKLFLKKQRAADDTIRVLKQVVKVVVGWINYHAVSDNERRVKQFINATRTIIRKWINRRGRKRPMS